MAFVAYRIGRKSGAHTIHDHLLGGSVFFFFSKNRASA